MHVGWTAFLQKARPNINPPERLLAIDPGDTTGWAFFNNGELTNCGVVAGHDVSERAWRLYELIKESRPTIIVCEEYRVYKTHLDQHMYSNIPTLKLIGAIELSRLLLDYKPGIVYQLAATGKAFCTDQKLKDWGLYQKNTAHTNDAIRHGCHYLLFGEGTK